MFNLHLARKQFTVMITKNVMFEPCNITRKIGKTLLQTYIEPYMIRSKIDKRHGPKSAIGSEYRHIICIFSCHFRS